MWSGDEAYISELKTKSAPSRRRRPAICGRGARIRYEGAQSAAERFEEIARVYEFNGFVSDVSALGSAQWIEGLIGEFPESGLVPTAYLYGFLGVSAEHDGLHIAPKSPDGYECMGVRKVSYGKNDYEICVYKDGTLEIAPLNGKTDFTLIYTPEKHAASFYNVCVQTVSETTENVAYADENGSVSIAICADDIKFIRIFPVES